MSNRSTVRSRLALVALAGATPVTFAASAADAALVKVTTTFEKVPPGEDPQQGWTFGVSGQYEYIREQANGNHYLYGEVDSFGVALRSKTDGSNAWVGGKDYRAAKVRGFEIVTGGTADFPNSTRDMAITLVHHNGTPDDYADDFGFYALNPRDMPYDGRPRVYRYPVPSEFSGDTPPGWAKVIFGPDSPTDFTWDKVITNVDEVQFNYYHPEMFYIIQFHYVGVDNISIVVERP